MLPDHVTWTGVVYAAIITLPAILAAVVGLLNRKQLATSNGKSVGTLVEEVHSAVPIPPAALKPEAPGK